MVASIYFNLGIALEFHWLRRQIADLSVQIHWHNLAKIGLVETLNVHQRELTAHILKTTKPYKSARKVIDQWIEANRFPFQRHEQMIAELKARTSVDFAMLSAVVSEADGLRAASVA